MKIYVVTGSCGQWEDKTEWIVGAFKEPSKAQYEVAVLNDAVDAAIKKEIEFDDFEVIMQQLDPSFFGSLGEYPYYYYVETELK